MKKLYFILISLFVIVPTIANAHTGLTSSNPTSGQVVTEDLKEIVLNFEGNIESLSTMNLVKDGQEIPFTSVQPQGQQMIGALSTPLENGSYNIQWTIAGEDGHPITGEIPFVVQKEMEIEQNTETNSTETDKKIEPIKENTKEDQTNSQTTESSSNSMSTITMAVIALLAIGLFLLFRRKR